MQQGVRVDRHDQRRGDRGQGGVQRAVFARFRLEDPAIPQAEPRRRRTRALGRVVGRVVVRQQDLQRARIRKLGKSLERWHDRVFFVPGGHDEGHGRPAAVRPGPSGRFQIGWPVSREDQREGEKADQQTGDVGERGRYHPGHDRADCALEIRAPSLRDVHAEGDVGEREGECQGEADRGPHAHSGTRAFRQTSERVPSNARAAGSGSRCGLLPALIVHGPQWTYRRASASALTTFAYVSRIGHPVPFADG